MSIENVTLVKQLQINNEGHGRTMLQFQAGDVSNKSEHFSNVVNSNFMSNVLQSSESTLSSFANDCNNHFPWMHISLNTSVHQKNLSKIENETFMSEN